MLRNNVIKHFNTQPFKKDKYLQKIEKIANKLEFGELEDATVEDGNKHIRQSNIKWIPCIQDDKEINALFEYINGFIYGANSHSSEEEKDGWDFELTTFEPLQYTVYDGDGAHYGWHTDNFLGPPEETVRKASFSILLNKPRVDFTGGDLVIENGGPDRGKNRRASVDLRQGDIVVFPSNTWHKVTPVTSGTRKSLVGWVRGPQWK